MPGQAGYPKGFDAFDLATDAGETQDRASDARAVLDRLRSAYAAWEAAMLEPIVLEDRFR